MFDGDDEGSSERSADRSDISSGEGAQIQEPILACEELLLWELGIWHVRSSLTEDYYWLDNDQAALAYRHLIESELAGMPLCLLVVVTCFWSSASVLCRILPYTTMNSGGKRISSRLFPDSSPDSERQCARITAALHSMLSPL